MVAALEEGSKYILGGVSLSVYSNFSSFCSNLDMSADTVSKIQNRYRQITKRINIDYRNSNSETANSWYVGSYGRGTEIWTSDIDILVHLPNETYHKFNAYASNGQSALLQEVKITLQKTYSNSYIKGDGQVIGLNFTDGINFEIVPAFINTSGSFTYPDSNNGGSWKVTDPKKEISAMNEKNSVTNGNLKRLCRMMRSWKGKCDVPISGILIDTLAYNFISTWPHRDKSYTYYDYMSRDFFRYLKEIDTGKYYWVSPGSGNIIYNFSNFQTKAAIAYDNTIKAIDYENRNLPATAKIKWREIYGSKFY